MSGDRLWDRAKAMLPFCPTTSEVYKRVSQIHPMVTLVGAFAGVHAFGLVGLLVGPLVLLYALELVNVHHAGEPLGSNGASVSTAPRKGSPLYQPAIPPTAAAGRSP